MSEPDPLSHSSPESQSGKPSEPASGLSLDALANEISSDLGDKDRVNMDLFAGLINRAGITKEYHDNGDLTVFARDCSFTQTVRDGGYFRVSTEHGEVVFHLRTDGDIDMIGPDFDDTLIRVNAGSVIFFWTNAAGTIRITFDEQRGFSTSSVDRDLL